MGDKMKTINYDNYFDYAEAIYCFCILNHEGLWSELYSILSQSQFKPSPLWTETRCENENPVYNEINEQNISELFNELQSFINERN
jgi:hypothetical protein